MCGFKVLTLLFLVIVVNVVTCYKILGLFPHAGKSHFDVFQPMFLELAKRGHDVTIIGHFPLKKPVDNYHDVSLVGTSTIGKNELPFGGLGTIGGGQNIGRFTHIYELAYWTNDICEKGFQSKDLQNFMAKKPKFDVVLTEFFTTNCFIGLMNHTGGSLIGLTSSVILPWVNDFMGGPDNPSYIPLSHMKFTNRMRFGERVENFLGYLTYKIGYKLLIDIPANREARKHIDPNLPPLNKFAYNASLVLANIHHTVHGPRPYLPSMVEVGGMHIGKPKKLPQNLEKWINESTHGVIYFSMGSMIKGDTFPEDKRIIFQNVFSTLKQRVLWKWENETMPGKPDNVMIQNWLPQFDILCHPNVKAFITHGGLLGTTEAVHCGVPAVVMPQFGDQYTNARALEASGGGVVLHFSTITEEDVYNALKTVLDPSFNKKAKELSARFKDRPMPPMETAIYWVEYVARHKGAPHLRSAAVGMPYYRYLLLDVIAFLLFLILLTFYVLYAVIKFVISKLSGKNEEKVKKN